MAWRPPASTTRRVATPCKTETWVNDPDGAPWEFYVKTGDAEQMTNTVHAEGETAQCCAPAAISDIRRRRRRSRVGLLLSRAGP